MCTLYVGNVWIKRKIEYPELPIFNGKLCTLYMYRMSRLAEKLNVQNSINWTGNCIYNLYGMSRFAKNLNIQNCENWTGYCVHYMRGMFTLAEKLNIPYCMYSIGYIIYVRNVWICKKIEYPELRKCNGKLCTIYMYGT